MFRVNAGAVDAALCHMYGGLCDLNDLKHGCTVSDLLIVADMYQLRQLTDIVLCTLEMDKCHLFHKVHDFSINI